MAHRERRGPSAIALRRPVSGEQRATPPTGHNDPDDPPRTWRSATRKQSKKPRPALAERDLFDQRQSAWRLLDSLIHLFDLPARGRGWIAYFQFVRADRGDDALLRQSNLIGERRAFKVEVDALVRLIDCVGAVVGNHALGNRHRFLRRRLRTVV